MRLKIASGLFAKMGAGLKGRARASKPEIIDRRRATSSEVDLRAPPPAFRGRMYTRPSNGFLGGCVELAQHGEERRAEGPVRVPVVVFQEAE